jgi:5-methylcytosine-specific restriction enzyme A
VSQWVKLYKSNAWQVLRLARLRAEPLCRFCKAFGRVVAATVVDHIRPHRGDLRLFLDEDNLQSLCKKCHDSHKKRQENSGHMVGHGLDGRPVDPNHHWNNP